MKNSLVEGDKNRATGRDGGRKKVEGTLDLEPEAKRRGSADVRITHRASYRQFGHDPVFVQPSATRENARRSVHPCNALFVWSSRKGIEIYVGFVDFLRIVCDEIE